MVLPVTPKSVFTCWGPELLAAPAVEVSLRPQPAVTVSASATPRRATHRRVIMGPTPSAALRGVEPGWHGHHPDGWAGWRASAHRRTSYASTPAFAGSTRGVP